MAAGDLNEPELHFLTAHGWGEASAVPIPGDASFRHYTRLVEGERRAILMTAPPPQEDVGPFLLVARYLAAHGFAAPEVIAANEARGLVLLGDLGDRRMREAVDAEPTLERPVYEAAVDLLVRLHRAEPIDRPRYDHPVLHREVDLFVDWWVPAAGLAIDREGWTRAWTAVLSALPPPSVTVLRDYHAENIMLGEGPAPELALLDFQDALVGHPAYDLVSLLQDARRDVSGELEAAMLARFRAANADEAVVADYHRLGAQRAVKVLGIFARLSRRDGKHRYLRLMPRVWRHLRADLAHPALAPVESWFAANVPDEIALVEP